MSKIPDSVRQEVRKRANNHCEYCLSSQEYVMGILQIDHTIPVAKGGKNDTTNLCLACELCNQYKWVQIESQDLETGNIVRLFNPRLQKWSEHFTWSENGTEIRALNPCGRATVNALKLNNTLAVMVRKNWVKAGWHPPVSQ
ncbi:HNH endonuclease signature motif containing protein [Cyanobacterium sp. Dongsha4]|uniref:HNH endonuclease n=1 Tax=Cyanobacterium sp. DS4 TaxID=2878255 RepID=UPI002E8217B7|nr:HNH endonuclease signature motif containing protein [Cyanobacterium sp. Dongsha4]WVL02277.1 HNH endonuclease [Cyanobacterium sp. Dongsha4]